MTKNINIRSICDMKYQVTEGGFVLTFLSYTGSEQAVSYHLHFDTWWLRIIGGILWDIVRDKQKSLSDVVSTLRNGA